ncbi:MAG: cobyrinate a,c-diamide synthase [Brotaphodocola sp.]
MKLKRVMIAAPKSGSGKTTVTCSLLQALKKMGIHAVSYKCGPDYIDPMFHKTVLGIPSKNLDTFFTDKAQTCALLLKDRKEEDFAVLEGVMGLYDGLGGIREEGSSYHLAKVTNTPIVLVVDAKGMGKSAAALIAGFLSYDTEHLIKGVIFNRMSKGYFEILKPMVEKELGIEVFGYIPEYKNMQLESRYLGLRMPEEIVDIRERLNELSDAFQRTVSVKKIMELAEQAEPIAVPVTQKTEIQKQNFLHEKPVIAVARDEAFCFYYEDNLRLLEEYGAKIQYFSPIHDEKLPVDCSALLLGGGYPELYAQQLSGNQAMMDSIRTAMKRGMPTVAECGGFMYLHAAIVDQNGKRHEMAGVLPGICTYTGKLVRFGYIKIAERESHFLQEGSSISGHEFHYFDSSENGESCDALKPVTGKHYPCVIAGEHYWLGFPHLYYPSNPEFAKRFVKMAES